MSPRTNKVMMLIGVASLLSLIPYGYLVGRLQNDWHQVVIGLSFITFFICFLICGVFARVATFYLKNPIYNTKGYGEDFTPHYDSEKGGYLSSGYNRKWERRMVKFAKTLGLIIEDQGKN
jgi:hypothetical protein